MLKDPFPQPQRPDSASNKIGGAYFASLKVKDPKSRIFVMVGLLLVLIVGNFAIKARTQTDQPEEITEVPSVLIGADAPRLVSGGPALDPALAERIADRGPDAQARWPFDAASYLLYESQVTPAVWSYGRNLLPLVPGSAAQIRKDPRAWRFKYVVFRGRIEWMEEIDYEKVYGKYEGGEIRIVQRGRVLVAGGEKSDPPLRVSFITGRTMTWHDRDKINPPLLEIKGGWVRMRGIFVKNYLAPNDPADPGKGSAPSLLVVATQTERDFEHLPVDSLGDIPFQIINDDPSIAETISGQNILAKNYPGPLYRLLKYSESRAGDEGAALREKERLEARAIDSKGTYEEVLGQPARFRTKYFGGLGIIAKDGLHRGPYDIEPNDAGVEGCFDGWIMTDETKLVQFLAPYPLMDRDWKRGTRIRWAGYFYKAKGYPAANRTRRLAPLIVLTELVEILPPKPDYKGQFMFAGLFLLGLLVMVWFIVREDGTKEEFRRRRSGRKIAEA